jgi:hypothetical protein
MAEGLAGLSGLWLTVNSINYHPKGRTAWFKDSEGNILALSQRL